MKKLIILTILAISICLQSGLILSKNKNTTYAAKNNTLIEKPDILPGPSIDDQKEENIIANKTIPNLSLFIIKIIGGLSMIFIIIGGVRFTIAFGEEDQLTKAKDNIKYAIIGFVVSILSYAIVSLVTNIKFTETKTSIFEIPKIQNTK